MFFQLFLGGQLSYDTEEDILGGSLKRSPISSAKITQWMYAVQMGLLLVISRHILIIISSWTVIIRSHLEEDILGWCLKRSLPFFCGNSSGDFDTNQLTFLSHTHSPDMIGLKMRQGDIYFFSFFSLVLTDCKLWVQELVWQHRWAQMISHTSSVCIQCP